MDMISHTKKRKIAECQEKSPGVKEVLSDEKSSKGILLKIGPWSSAEDEQLNAYVSEFGAKKWEDVKKRTRLLRSGKSCRLRWLNHLRPELKKGPLTREEKNCIIKLHYKSGNQWSLIASKLPGRTDNEVKNFWNTRLKKCQHTGEPIYPTDTCSPIENEIRQSNEMMSNQNGDNYQSDVLQTNANIMIPHVEFKRLWSNQEINSYLSRICRADNISSTTKKISEDILRTLNNDIAQQDYNVMNFHTPVSKDHNVMNAHIHVQELLSIQHKCDTAIQFSSPSHEDVDAFFQFSSFDGCEP
ncbi:unnamed protein product [Amaranthus hypochondriacus]